jgi:hypothetical protein
MSILKDRIQEELLTVDIKALIVDKVKAKIDEIIETKNLAVEISRAIKTKISIEVQKEING